MSDASVAEALRSNDRLVVIEAPAGCGKTYQAAEYARWIAQHGLRGQTLILTHTHAACGVFRSRTQDIGRHITITTLDGLIAQIGGMYHQSLGLPLDVSLWARTQKNGFDLLAVKVASFLRFAKNVTRALAQRYTTIICDEHQDTSAAQNAVVMALKEAGARVRIFGDPVQSIYDTDRSSLERWSNLVATADRFEELDTPHRWIDVNEVLGQWVLAARAKLKNGEPIDLRQQLPPGLTVVKAINSSPMHGGYQVDGAARKQIDNAFNVEEQLLVLCAQNSTIRSLRAFWGRRVLIWEGHTQEEISSLIEECKQHTGDARSLASAVVNFIQKISIGFTAVMGRRLVQETQEGCVKKTRGDMLHLQNMAKLIIENPNHIGVGRALGLLKDTRDQSLGFNGMQFDLYRALWDAVNLQKFSDPDEGITILTQRRYGSNLAMPLRCLSTIHKAKGLESEHAIVVPSDAKHFGKAEKNRCVLYVALSRARKNLTIVVDPKSPSPWLIL